MWYTVEEISPIVLFSSLISNFEKKQITRKLLKITFIRRFSRLLETLRLLMTLQKELYNK